jgi:hypothetical protein
MMGPRTLAIPQIPPMKPCQYPLVSSGVISADGLAKMLVKPQLIWLTDHDIPGGQHRYIVEGEETYDIPIIVPPPNPLNARQIINLVLSSITASRETQLTKSCSLQPRIRQRR